MAKWTVFMVLCLAVLLLTISRLRRSRGMNERLVDRDGLGSKQELWCRILTNLCMCCALAMMVFMHRDPLHQTLMMVYDIYASIVVSFGNLQIPAAVFRVVLALFRLIPHDYYYASKNDLEDERNLTPSLNILYGMVLGQGTLYIVACVLDIFSFVPRRSLARRGGFRGQWGTQSVSMYYGYAMEKCMERDVLAPKKTSLSSFAMDSLNSDSPKMQLHGVQLMHILLQTEPTKTRLLAKLTTCSKTSARLISMLDWTNARNTKIVLFAGKVTAELAKNLRVVTIPGTVQIVSTLLDHGKRLKLRRRANPLMDTDGEQGLAIHDPILNASDNQEGRSIAVPVPGSNLLETHDGSTQQVDTAEQGSWIVRCRQCMWKCRSNLEEQEQPPTETDQDLLPALGMSILYNLAACDHINCKEIVNATGLIPKIIGFTSYCSCDMAYTETQWKVLVNSSLRLLHRLTRMDGEIGILLRHEASKHPFLLRNLARILEDGTSSQESRKLATGTLRNLAVDGNTRQEIGCIQVIITSLVQEFLSSGTQADHLLKKVAGQALAMLAMGSVHNCSVILNETGRVFIKELTTMIHDDRYRCVAASLLRSMCLHARHEFRHSDLQALSYTVREVLERIMDAEGAELETLIGLSSQICRVIPEGFTRELEQGYIKDRFVKRLVDALNANMEPSADWPGMRRAILEQVIGMMEHDSSYASYFNRRRMTEAMSRLEETASKAENYAIFLGDAGFIEHSETLLSLVARVKHFLTVHSSR